MMMAKLFCCISFISQAFAGDIEDVKSVAKQAGDLALKVRSEGLVAQDVELANGKKVRQTNADLETGQLIADELSKITPDFGQISQDLMDKDPKWFEKRHVWLINPIDGTKNFEKGSDDFHVQIGLLDQDQPVLGVVYYPAKDVFVWAKRGEGAWIEEGGLKRRLIVKFPQENVLIQSSSFEKIKPLFDEWEWIPDQVIEEHLSSTTRLLKIIEGEASLYISLGASPEGTEKKGGIWNYGANAVIAEEAGLILKTLNGHPLDLHREDALLAEGVVLTNDADLYSKVVDTDWHLSFE
ncbi:MAG: hypothetical protein K1X28_04170 [Parachlamydiales bacterium]|nr:hypothetical protein [Parachlamydiales bacterium]